MAPILPASSFGPDPFLTPPAIERGGRTFGYASASQNWRNSVNEARGNMITSASQGQGSRSCDYFNAKMRGSQRTAKSDRSKPALTMARDSLPLKSCVFERV